MGNFGLVVDPPCDKIRLDEFLARAGAVVDDPAPVNLGPLIVDEVVELVPLRNLFSPLLHLLLHEVWALVGCGHDPVGFPLDPSDFVL